MNDNKMAEKSTIQKDVFLSGIGIHSGENVDLLLKPSSSGEITLMRRDLKSVEIRIDPQKIKTKRGSFLDAEVGKILTLD